MITLEDCLAFCGLTEEEVLAIAEHEHMPEIAAAAFAEYLRTTGPWRIQFDLRGLIHAVHRIAED